MQISVNKSAIYLKSMYSSFLKLKVFVVDVFSRFCDALWTYRHLAQIREMEEAKRLAFTSSESSHEAHIEVRVEGYHVLKYVSRENA